MSNGTWALGFSATVAPSKPGGGGFVRLGRGRASNCDPEIASC